MKTILTCGHSARSFDDFTELLQQHRVQLLVDVRSKPFSRYCPWFNRSYLEAHLPMQYVWIRELGGLEIVHADVFEEAVETLIRYAKRYKACVMCSEKDHTKCHRTTKIAPALQERGIKVFHIGT